MANMVVQQSVTIYQNGKHIRLNPSRDKMNPVVFDFSDDDIKSILSKNPSALRRTNQGDFDADIINRDSGPKVDGDDALDQTGVTQGKVATAPKAAKPAVDTSDI